MMASDATKKKPPTQEQSFVQVQRSCIKMSWSVNTADAPPVARFYRSPWVHVLALNESRFTIIHLEKADAGRSPPCHCDQKCRVNRNGNLVDQSLLRQPDGETWGGKKQTNSRVILIYSRRFTAPGESAQLIHYQTSKRCTWGCLVTGWAAGSRKPRWRTCGRCRTRPFRRGKAHARRAVRHPRTRRSDRSKFVAKRRTCFD